MLVMIKMFTFPTLYGSRLTICPAYPVCPDFTFSFLWVQSVTECATLFTADLFYVNDSEDVEEKNWVRRTSILLFPSILFWTRNTLTTALSCECGLGLQI